VIETVSAFAAFTAGLLSFFTPCILPLVPIYLGYMAGTASATSAKGNIPVLAHAASFVLGFSLVFILLGAAAGLLGGLIGRLLPIVVRIGGLFLIILGLHMCGLLRIPFLNMDKHLEIGNTRNGFWASFLVGIVFAAGWTPCIGPVLASILMLAASTQMAPSGALLLGLYALGLGIPFLVAGGLFNLAAPYLRKIGRWSQLCSTIGGILLMGMGFLLVTGLFQHINGWVNSLI